MKKYVTVFQYAERLKYIRREFGVMLWMNLMTPEEKARYFKRENNIINIINSMLIQIRLDASLSDCRKMYRETVEALSGMRPEGIQFFWQKRKLHAITFRIKELENAGKPQPKWYKRLLKWFYRSNQ